MKRLPAVAWVLALFVLPAFAQRGGSHGGGSHSGSFGGHAGGGFSSRGGGFSGFHSAPRTFSGGHSGFSVPRAPSFRSGFGNPRPGNYIRTVPPRLGGGFNPTRGFAPRPPAIHSPYQLRSPDARQLGRPPQSVSGRMPYPGRGVRPVGPAFPRFRQSDLNSVSNRMAYHSPRDGGHRGGGGDNHDHGWDHRGHDRDHDHDHWHDHDRYYGGFGFYGLYGWAGYPYYWPWYGWGYPYLLNTWDWNDDDYDSQPAGNYAASQYPEYAPGPAAQAYPDQTYPDQASPDQPEPQQPGGYTPWPYSSPAPSSAQPAPDDPPAVPATSAVTLVFKDGRPNQTIHNYLLTSTTLSVLDTNRRDIPVDQIDIPATARLNRQSGVDFSLPEPARN